MTRAVVVFVVVRILSFLLLLLPLLLLLLLLFLYYLIAAPPKTRRSIRNRIRRRLRRCRNHPHQIVGRRRLVVVGLVLGLASAMGSVPVVVIVAIVAEAVEGVLEVSSIRRCCVVRRVAIVYQYYELLAISILLEIEPNKSLSSVFSKRRRCSLVSFTDNMAGYVKYRGSYTVVLYVGGYVVLSNSYM